MDRFWNKRGEVNDIRLYPGPSSEWPKERSEFLLDLNIEKFLGKVKNWGEARQDIKALFLVGSYARGKAREDSDIDLVVLTDQPDKYLDDDTFTRTFGITEKIEKEYWGRVTSLRIWYKDGFEVELGVTTPDWITERPLDSGTLRVLTEGALVLIDNIGGIEELIISIQSK